MSKNREWSHDDQLHFPNGKFLHPISRQDIGPILRTTTDVENVSSLPDEPIINRVILVLKNGAFYVAGMAWITVEKANIVISREKDKIPFFSAEASQIETLLASNSEPIQ